jgi:hypothetical protein
MSSDEYNFDVCPQGSETDTFHERILNGLLDTFSELAERYQQILEVPETERDQDEKDFVSAYDRVGLELEQLKDTELAYDKKYKLAHEVQMDLMDLKLL